jgi:ankyrin repeat protein
MANERSKKQGIFDERALAAVESNDITFLQNLLNQRLAEDPNAFLPYANLGSSLNRALELSRYDMADELFKRGAEWNYGTMGDVLEGAREDNEWNTKAIDTALAHGWNIDEHYEHVGSALVYTVGESSSDPDYLGGGTVCLKLAAYLLSKGADVDEGGQTGNNPLELACTQGDKRMAALLLAHNATMERAPKALLHAARNGDIEIMQMLLDHGANVNVHPYGRYTTVPQERKREDWGSALHCAIGKGHTEAVRFLLEKGAAKEYKNKLDMTALDLAKKLGNDEIVQLLQ